MGIKTLIFTFICIGSAFGLPLAPHLLGEQNFEHYYGPSYPYYFKDKKFGKTVFEEQKYFNQYPYSSIGLELYDLKEFIKELNTAGLCPNEELAQHAEYIRYLYRMSALSYLSELFFMMEEESKKMNLGEVCEVSINELLNTCDPKSKDMKLFIKSSSILSRSFSPFVAPYNFDFEKYFIDWSKSNKGAVAERLLSECSDRSCLKSKDKLKKLFQQSCEQDKKLFTKICSEKDGLYGISYVEQLFHVISYGDVMKVFNDNGNARGCLARYTSVMKDRESFEPNFYRVFPLIFEYLKKEDLELGGRLFPAGSLRVFVKEGLDEIFIEKKVQIKKVTKVETNKEVELAPLAPAPIKKVLQPKKEKEKTSKKRVVVKKKPKKSHFLISAQALEEFSMDRVDIDMLKFRYDYLFNSKMLDYLEQQMPKFFSREGLEEMKNFDSLGSKKGPVPLLFIKYLIENDKHQGLFNLIDVIGDQFYVRNNIDDESIANENDFVRLEFRGDAATAFWQLSIVRD